MKKLLLYLALLIVALPAMAQNGPGNDTTKYIWYKYQYGIRYPRAQFDSVLIPPKDTAYAKAGIATKNGIFFYWDGTKWTSPGGGSGGTITAVVGTSPITANTVGGTVSIGADTSAAHLYALATQYDLSLKEPLIVAVNTPHYFFNGYKKFVPLNTDSITEGGQKFFSNALARAAISLTTTGTGAATYSSSTGVLNIPTPSGGGGSGNTNSNIGAGFRLAVPGTNNIKTVYGSGVIIDSATHANALTFTIDSTIYATRRWVDSSRTAGGGSDPDTITLNQLGSGIPMLKANSSPVLDTRTVTNDYGILTDTAKTGKPLNIKADTTSIHGLVSKDRLATITVPVVTNLGTGFRDYIPGSGLRTYFNSYALNWDSAINTNGLTLKLDTTLMATRAYVLGHGGSGGGGPDTVTLNQLGSGYQMLTANSTATLNTRTVTKDYGILIDTLLTGKPLSIGADTTSVHGLVSKDRLNGVIISATGHPKPSYGTYVNSDSVKTDTTALKAKFVGTIIVGDSTYDNAPTITQALAIAANLGIRFVELPEGSVNIKSNWVPQSGVWLKSAGRGTIIRGNFTSDHYLFNYNSATPLNDIGFINLTWDRRGPNVSHGWMGGNVHYVHFIQNRFIDNDTTAAGGALGISAFAPFATYPSDHIYVDDCEFIGSGNFGVQAGNADWVYVRRPRGFRNYREFMGTEPYDLGGEGGKVRHMYVTDAHNYNPDNTAVNGSATGVYIITGSSGGKMDDIVYTNCVDSGGVQSSMHGFHVLTGNNVTLINCRSVYTGGYGYQVTSSAFGESRNIHLINCYAARNGRDGTRNAGLRVHDTQMSDFDIISEGNTYGFIEDGTSQLNKFSGNVATNTNTYSLNTGRPHFSVLRDLITDSTYPKSTVMAYADTAQGSRIIASRGTKFPALLDIKTGDSLYLKKGDTLDANLEKVMANSSILSTDHLIYHIGKRLGDYGAIYNPYTHYSGAQFFNQGGLTSAAGWPRGSMEYVDSAGVAEHLYFMGRRTAPYDLLAGGGSSNYDSAFTGYKYYDSTISGTPTHVGIQYRRHDGTYTDITRFTFTSGGGGGGGGGSTTFDQALTNGHDSVTGSHYINFGTGGGLAFAALPQSPTFFNNITVSGFATLVSNSSGSSVSPADFSGGFYSVTPTVNNMPFNLPANITAGTLFYIQKADAGSNTILLSAPSGKTINGSPTFTLAGTQYKTATLIALDATGNYRILSVY